MSQAAEIAHEEHVKRCNSEKEKALKRKADQKEKAQVAVQRDVLAKAAKRGHTIAGAWADLAAKQGSVTVETLKGAAVGVCFALYDRNYVTDEWRKVRTPLSTWSPHTLPRLV